MYELFPILEQRQRQGVGSMSGGRRSMCMGDHAHGGDDVADLRREVRELREEVSPPQALRCPDCGAGAPPRWWRHASTL